MLETQRFTRGFVLQLYKFTGLIPLAKESDVVCIGTHYDLRIKNSIKTID
jgi:hypothetical protein